MPRTRPPYPPEFRAEAVRLAPSSGKLIREVFSYERMYRFTGGQPGTLGGLRASFARIEAGRANDRDGTAQRNWTVRHRADGQWDIRRAAPDGGDGPGPLAPTPSRASSGG